MLYPKNSKAFQEDLFQNPTSEYRGTPFWAWNCKLETETILEQIEMLKKMGMGGYHVHVRTGMASPYLTDEFMEHVRTALDKGKEENMLTWLYDEDRWPSGAAGGLVTKAHPEYRIRYLVFTPDRFDPAAGKIGSGIGSVVFVQEEAEFLAAYDISLNDDGSLAEYRKIGEDDEAKGDKWYAYLVWGSNSGWFNDQTYADTMNPKAIAEFARVTYDRYAECFQSDFGGDIPAIFTDEPQYVRKSTLGFAHEKKDVFLPWTGDFAETFAAAYSQDILAGLPELFWELPGGEISLVRYHFHDHAAERFAEAFSRTLGDWCGEHNLMLTGHLMKEESLESQTSALGECMRNYGSFQLPGIDILCDRHEYNTAKQTQSAVRQQGAPGMLSELYGVTGWDWDFRGHKLQGDWQAALGVTVRVLHLTWMSMKGEAKRDYPAAIGYQSPWYDQYALVEDHFARVNTALTRGKAVVRVAVVHPVESYWLHWGPSEQTKIVREQMEQNFASLTEILLFGSIDFDFLCESQLPSLCDKGTSPLKVGQMEYDTVIVPACETLRASTLQRLEEFEKAGGRLIFIGKCPTYIDAVRSDAARPLYERSTCIDFDGASILKTLESERFIDIRGEDGSRTNHLVHQLRRDGDDYWLFVAPGKNPQTHYVDEKEQDVRFTLDGEYIVTLYNTLTGEISPLPCTYRGGKTVFTRRWYMHDSLLVRLAPGKAAAAEAISAEKPSGEAKIFLDKVPVTLHEPNALLLDMAEFAFDDEEYRPTEEILRADNYCRERLGIPLRKKHVTQPYLIKDEAPTHSISLRFTINSEIAVKAPQLAGECMEDMSISLNGEPVAVSFTGWYVDKAIQTIAMPEIKPGKNILEIKSPIGERTNLEWFYLLGDFGVRVDGAVATIIPPVSTLGFSDYTYQGLPFFTGNLTYHLEVETTGSKLCLRTPVYRGALIRVAVDGEDKGAIIYSPYTLELDGLAPGKHSIDITLYGTRQNAFAQLHHTQSVFFYQSPDSWRSKGDLWCYEYQLKAAGILKSPEFYGDVK